MPGFNYCELPASAMGLQKKTMTNKLQRARDSTHKWPMVQCRLTTKFLVILGNNAVDVFGTGQHIGFAARLTPD